MAKKSSSPANCCPPSNVASMRSAPVRRRWSTYRRRAATAEQDAMANRHVDRTDGIAIVGGGICGLSLALNLHQRGIPCTVYESAPEVKELGVGITLLPHAMRELTMLGVADALLAAGIESRESCFFNRFGQLIYNEKRGKHAGYDFPEVMIHRGRLHMILYRAACARLGEDRIRTNHDCIGIEQDEDGATVAFREFSSGRTLESVRASAVIACEGINSVIRRQFYPDEQVAFAGINTWR